MSSSVANITCYSQQGKGRESNRDFVGVFELEQGVLVYLLDVATSSSLDCTSFVEKLNQLLSDQLSQEIVLKNNIFIEVFQQIIIELKQSFKSGVASLITCFISYESEQVWGYIAGDSRLGALNENISWLSPVHTGANVFGEDFTDAMRLQPERHILTRSLNMRKRYAPEFFQLNITKDQSIVIGSDGFWAELTPEQQLHILSGQQIDTEDDSSVVVIKNSTGAMSIERSDLLESCYYKNLMTKD